MLSKVSLPVIIIFFQLFLFSPSHLLAQSPKDSATTKELFAKLVYKDSMLFNAVFSTCNMKDIEAILTEDFQFCQDNGDPSPASGQKRADFIAGIQKNFCEGAAMKMRREIEQGSLRIYPLSDNQVIQTGIQHFYLLASGQQDKLVEVSRFTRTWQKEKDDWKMSKEFDAISNTYSNHPHDALYDTIAHEDSALFNAFNAHDAEKVMTFFTDDLEFYHDLGGLTNYVQNMEAFKNNFAKNNGLRRELVTGSLEVYNVKNFGAMEIGEHKFCHEENGRQDCGTFKFGMVWKRTNKGWKISRVLSYGH